MDKPESIDQYIAGFPDDVQQILEQVRATIRQTAPNATEAISYAIPTFKQKGNLIHFAAFKNHIGLYPTPAGVKEFEADLSQYKTGKGSIQFPLDKPMPLELIIRMVKFRMAKKGLT